MDLAMARGRLIHSELGKGCSREVLARLFFEAEPRSVAAGAVLFEKGELAGRVLMLLVDGALQVGGADITFAATEATGGILLGEVGLLNPTGRRTATLLAAGECALLQWRFDALAPDLQAALMPVLERVAFDRISGLMP